MKNQVTKREESQTVTLKPLSIRELSAGVKIREMSDLAPLKMALAHCFKLVGLNEIPNSTEVNVLIDFIIESYGGLCAQEMTHAFKLGCSKRFDCDMTHYQNFSAEYLGRVLKAYSEYRAKELSRTQSKQLTDFTEEQIDRKQYYELNLFMKFDALSDQKYIFTDSDEVLLYRNLTQGLNIQIATVKQKFDSMQIAEELEPKKFRESQDDRMKRVKSRAKRICFQNWIQRMADEGVDLRTEINKIIETK